MSYATTHIHDYSIKFYKTLEAETGLNPGFSVMGNLRMAQTDARMDEYRVYATTAETCGVPYEWMTPAQIKERWPLVRTEDLKGAIYHPTDGYINPADVTMAMAKGARQHGVAIERKWQVDAYDWTGDHWRVTTTKMVERGGNLIPSDEQVVIIADHVVTATGNHAQRTAPAYDRQKALGAQFGCVNNGWERPNYYGPLDAPTALTMTPAVFGGAIDGNMRWTRPRPYAKASA